MADLGEIMRGEGPRYLESRRVPPVQRKAVYDIAECRTAAMGAVLNTCEDCSVEYWHYRSCRNRSCPLCQGAARANWLAARAEELLPIAYLHAVFNVPSEFNVLARYCPKALYEAVIRSVGQAIIDTGWSELHARLGCLIQLQTWTQSLAYLLHAHCVIPCGGFSEDGSRWITFQPHDLPAGALAARFRTLLGKAIRTAAQEGKFQRLPKAISVDQILEVAEGREWRVYAEPPFGGPEQMLAYLAQYTNRVAITNDRIESYENHQVTLRGRRSRHGQVQSFRLEGPEFVQRYLWHVPPRGFVRIRSYGFMANRNRKRNLERARRLIGQTAAPCRRERVRPMRLCPACYEIRRAQRSQITLNLRPPPAPVAA